MTTGCADLALGQLLILVLAWSRTITPGTIACSRMPIAPFWEIGNRAGQLGPSASDGLMEFALCLERLFCLGDPTLESFPRHPLL